MSKKREGPGDPERESTQTKVDRWDEGWDAETTAMLRELFVQEAQEHVTVMGQCARRLLEQPEQMRELLRRAHTLKGSAATVGLFELQQAAHDLEECCVVLQQDQQSLTAALIGQLSQLIDALREMSTGEEPATEALARFRGLLRRFEQRGQEEDVPSGDRRQGDRRMMIDRRGGSKELLRVEVRQVEELMNAVGQLVIDRTRIERRVEELKGLARDLSASRQGLRGAVAALRDAAGEFPQTRVGEVAVEIGEAVTNLERATVSLTEDSERLRRTTRQLEEQLTRVRMMPIRWLYARLQRPLREMARSEGKQIELITEGESTEMDRSVVERITDPLIHLIRNAVAHGIEQPERRVARGKSEVGVIRVSARHSGEMLLLEVADDGAGIDAAEVREAARRCGEVAVDRLSDAEVLDLIFTSGLSTRPRADELAGRGLGLDVVRHNIGSLGGEIWVESRPAEGSRFCIRLPMTTAIAQALLLRVAEDVYAVPLAHVVGTQVVDPGALQQGPRGKEVETRFGRLSVVVLEELLGIPRPGVATRSRQALVLLSYGKRHFAVTCRRVVGPREIVLKRLGRLLAANPLLAGGTISGSNKVQLVLDVAALAHFARHGWEGRAAAAPLVPDSPRVLLADDSRSIREAVSLILGGAGYAVDAVADGWDAWERLQGQRYGLLVTDLEMPRVHGRELIARCRREPTLADLPILVLTSRSADATRERALAVGASDFVAKPIDRRALLRLVQGLLHTRPKC